ncbi:MAG: YdeI/OmpD-associated family protein [Candidatus Limnocylindrales bacterium]
MAERPVVEPRTRAEWRAWLQSNHATVQGVSVVYPRRGHAGPDDLDYESIVLEALCFGWIDSTAGVVDGQRVSLYVARRKRGGGWAATNKARVERLLADGLMAPAGITAVEQARADGSWTLLDAAEAAREPPDLEAALVRYPGARERWDAFPRSVRKQLIGWVDTARRPATRAARVEEIASLAAQGIRANEQRAAGGRANRPVAAPALPPEGSVASE